MSHDGNISITENIADHGGVKSSYMAYGTNKITNIKNINITHKSLAINNYGYDFFCIIS